jgi:hypoxia-inducible factor (prolyl hydroxylase)
VDHSNFVNFQNISGGPSRSIDPNKFDQRPLKKADFEKPPSNSPEDLALFVSKQLEEKLFCVIDGIVPDKQINHLFAEVQNIEASGLFKDGQLAGGRTSGEDEKKVVEYETRSDQLLWIEGNERGYPNICQQIHLMDEVITKLNPHLEKKYFINGRTKVHVHVNNYIFSQSYCSFGT